MAKVTGTKKESSEKSNLKDTLKKIKKFTPMGMTVEIAKKTIEKIKGPEKEKRKFAPKLPKPDGREPRLPVPRRPIKLPKRPNMLPKQKDSLPKRDLQRPRPDKLLKELKDRPAKFFNKGGRVGLKAGSKGCKLAMKGRGRAYGKNS